MARPGEADPEDGFRVGDAPHLPVQRRLAVGVKDQDRRGHVGTVLGKNHWLPQRRVDEITDVRGPRRMHRVAVVGAFADRDAVHPLNAANGHRPT